MEPRIQYARAADGVNIAFWTIGEGMAYVVPDLPFSHIQLEWQMRGWRRWYERLAEKRMLIRYDGRGTGLSERKVNDHSLDAHLLDLQAVVDRLGVRTFALCGSSSGWPVVTNYAIRHPEAVSEGDWELYTEATAHAAFGWSAAEEGSALRQPAILQDEPRDM